MYLSFIPHWSLATKKNNKNFKKANAMANTKSSREMIKEILRTKERNREKSEEIKNTDIEIVEYLAICKLVTPIILCI